jgi:hypothetical protein
MPIADGSRSQPSSGIAAGSSGARSMRSGAHQAKRWPSRPRGSPRQPVTRRKCSRTAACPYAWWRTSQADCAVTSMPSSSWSSRASAAATDSPGSTLPPGNSHQPA